MPLSFILRQYLRQTQKINEVVLLVHVNHSGRSGHCGRSGHSVPVIRLPSGFSDQSGHSGSTHHLIHCKYIHLRKKQLIEPF
jgi:hypothetical protein